MTSTAPDQATPHETPPEHAEHAERALPHQAIYRAWRAQTFAGIVGQEATVAALRNAVRTGRVAHALLFVGPRGTGKTSMARIVAKALNCTDLRDGEPCDRCAACVAVREGTSLDVAEMDAASNNKVDDMRELLPRIATAPSDLRRKVFIVDEVQRIKEGWDVLLKTLEEPPDHVAFIFCTTDAGGIRPAILSRVQRYDFRKLTVDQIAGKLRHILAASGREADDDAVELIARAAAGGMRDAESMLDQLLSGAPEKLTADRVRDILGLAGAEAVDAFLDALLAPEPLAGLAILDELDERGRDARTFLDQVMERVRARLVASLAGHDQARVGDAGRLTAVGRRLAAIDPARLGPGGLRFQLELLLLGGIGGIGGAAAAGPAAVASVPSPRPAPARVTAADPPPRPAAAPTVAEEPPAPAPPVTDPPATPAPSSATAAPAVPAASSATSATAEPAAPAVPARPAEAPRPAAPALQVATDPDRPAAPAPAPAASAPESSSASPRTAGTPGAGPDMDALLAAWPVVVREMSRLPALKQLIVESRPIAVEDGIVTLGFPEGRAFLRDAADKRKSSIEDGLAKVMGRAMRVRCVVTNLDAYPPLAEDAEAEHLLAEARRIFADDLADVGEVS